MTDSHPADEDVRRLLESSSLGTDAARKIQARTPEHVALDIRNRSELFPAEGTQEPRGIDEPADATRSPGRLRTTGGGGRARPPVVSRPRLASELLLLTNAPGPSAESFPSLGLLTYSVRVAPLEASALLDSPPVDVVVVDGRRDLVVARGLCRLLRITGLATPLLFALVTEGGLAAVSADWGVDDVLLDSAGPAEVEARIRLAVGRAGAGASAGLIQSGDLSVDEATYSAKLRGRPLELTFKEFELLKYLAQHPGRVFTRAQLLQEVWGYDYYGGTRTVDVHVRRLRAKLGPEYESMIGTVRHVGYKFVSLPIAALPENRATGANRAQREELRDCAPSSSM